MGLLPKKDEFNSKDEVTAEETDALDLVADISKAIQIPLMRPKGKHLTAFAAYLRDFSPEQRKLFIEKLKTSSYVRNSAFRLRNVVKWDLINSLTAGTSKEAGRFYTVQRIYINEPMPNMPSGVDR